MAARSGCNSQRLRSPRRRGNASAELASTLLASARSWWFSAVEQLATMKAAVDANNPSLVVSRIAVTGGAGSRFARVTYSDRVNFTLRGLSAARMVLVSDRYPRRANMSVCSLVGSASAPW